MSKVLPIRPLKLGPSDFQMEVERLKAEGKMPSLDLLLDALTDARKIYRAKILAARRGKKGK
jgi:hypothetical protein